MALERDVVLHSWCVQSDWDAPTVVGGRGARLLLQDGREVLDMSSLAECSNLGHQHPRLVDAIRRQASELCFVTSSWGAAPRAELAARLIELGGFEGGRVFFSLSGADANENAVRIARLAAGRPHGAVVARERSYHGATELGMALSGDSRCRPFRQAADYGVLRVPAPYAYRCPFGTATAEDCARAAVEAVARTIDGAGPDGVAAVMMEPNAGTNGIVAPDGYWPALREATRKRGVWLIADEVMSGFGRCGEWFAWQRHGEAGRPDLMTLAKGLTGATVPLAATVLGAEVARRVEGQMLYAGLTYCGHPLACAAGLAAIEAYREERLVERSRRLGAAMLSALQRMAVRHPVIGDARGGHGLFAVVELVADRATRQPLAPWPQQTPALTGLVRAAMEQGVSFAARGNLLILAPPLVIEEAELDAALSLLDRLLGQFFPVSPEAAP